MTEPRMRARQKGQQFATAELEALLHAFGSASPQLPSTLTVLDEIITDYILETCHSASLTASLAHRAKIKIDDFKFALRKDPKKLGKVTELLSKQGQLKKERSQFDVVKAVPEWGPEGGKGRRGKRGGKREREGSEGEDGETGGKGRKKKAKKGKVVKKEVSGDEDGDGEVDGDELDGED